ncbi:hypothetical protein CTI12_AA454840 [Artemisia annua]|uniref:Photosystem I reaction center subunit II, chloroplastic n=1 Tax=Artemisia annua TaxID=35608 RepID=A0A2U1LTV0_ARTAN|nr:hypothetical protein CTI12_AA454840 [Artemisia annua]
MDDLVVYFDERVRDGVYHGLHLGFRRVIVKEINQKDLPTKNELSDNLKKFNNNKRFLRFYGIEEFQNRSFLIFESYSHDTTEEALFKETFSKEELFKKLRFNKAVAWMHGSPINFWGNINTSTVVVVKNDQGQSRLKLLIKGFGHESKNNEDDMRGLGEVLDHCISLFESASPESDHLIECLKDGRCKITHLINHPTFWTTPERKLHFISAVYEGLGDDSTFTQSLPDIEQAIYDYKKGNLDLHFVRRMEMYGSFVLIPNPTRLDNYFVSSTGAILMNLKSQRKLWEGVYLEKVNVGRQGAGQNMRSIGKNVSPIEVKFTGKQPYDIL